jgi:hypothetical protein
MHFYAVGGATQHKTILLSKTNLSPAQEMFGKYSQCSRQNASGQKTVKNPQPTIRASAMAWV